MSYYQQHNFMMEIRRKDNNESLLPLEEVSYEFGKYEHDHMRLYYAKNRYIAGIEQRIKYEPNLRKKLEGVEWYADGVEV